MMSTPDSAVLVLAGFVAGVVGTAGGITSLVSYPVLLAVGLPALSANVTNNVALIAGWPGSALASRPELRGKAPWLWRHSAIAAVGGAAGAVLLLCTPSGVFARVVPFLVAAASVALLFEPRLRASHQRRGERANQLALPAGVAALSIYNGYFGAGSGVMLLTLLLIVVDRHLPTANALKNMIVGAASLVSAAIFACSGHVDWSAAAPLAVGMLAGSSFGPRVARRLPSSVLRRLIVVVGLGLAIYLLVHPGA